MHQVAYYVCPIRKCPTFSPDSLIHTVYKTSASAVSLGSLALCLHSVCISGLLEFKRKSGEDKEGRDEKGKVRENRDKTQLQALKGSKIMKTYSPPLHIHCFHSHVDSCTVPLA